MEDIIKIFGGSFIAGLIITALINVFKKHGFGVVNIVKNSFGALFLFSATVKGIDPTGTAIKMAEYFEELHVAFMAPFSQTFSVIMIVAEFLLGLALIIGWRKELTLWLLIIMNVFFTFLTGYTTVTGNVTDCGCFGDFIKQTPMESFIKDLILLALLLIIYLGRKQIKEVFSESKALMLLAIVGFGVLYFNFANFYFDKPMVDFRPYAVGKDINAQRVEIADKLDYGFKFKELSSGNVERVVMGEYAKYKEDPAWEFTGEQDNIILEKGVPAIISNYAAFSKEGYEVTDELLLEEGYSIWVLSKSVDDSYEDSWSKISVLDKYAQENNIRMYAFTSSAFEVTETFKEKYNLSFPFYQADETFIKTVIRANPGVVLTKNGVVVGKWQHKHIPDVTQLTKLMK